MTTKTLDDFLPEVSPLLDGCPDQLAKNAIRNTIIELCERATIWRYDLDPVSISANVNEYDLTLPSSSYVANMLRVKIDGETVFSKSRDALDEIRADWETAKGSPIGYFLKSDKRKIRIALTPTAFIANGLVMEASLKPTRAATTVEEFIWQEHLEIIAAGALSRLFSIPGQKWSNAIAAKDNKDKFDLGCADRNVQSARSQSRTEMRTTPIYSLG